MVDEERVTAWNWQTGVKDTVWLNSDRTPEQRRSVARKVAQRVDDQRKRADEAARIAQRLVSGAVSGAHAYLSRKGFPEEKALTVDAAMTREIGGKYLISGERAIVIPARIGGQVRSVQLIWEDGTKKFLAGGEMGGASHRISSGSETWLCEGFATGLSLRAALHSLYRPATILVCFSASNIVEVAKTVRGRCFIAADHDAPPKAKPEQFGGLGAGEYYARAAEKPYLMPDLVGTDINDLHCSSGIFAVQSLILSATRQAGRRVA
jgi:putative DNA primase/helicase